MAIADDLSTNVQNVISIPWSIRKGQKVPSTEEVALSGGAVELNATFLYADLAKSSKLVNEFDRRVAAKIMKSFIACTCRLIRACNGSITSFDGDRVMGIFIGNTKNSNAARCALHINYAVTKIIRPKFENQYDSIKNSDFTINHGVGVDTGTVIAVRAGARGANDLDWVGRPPNLAAKLSDIRESPYNSIISAPVYNKLNDNSKYGDDGKENMWQQRSWNWLGKQITVYRSNWHWKP
jgi:adenylate cyclase